MTTERQDIIEDFYAGNYKNLLITVTENGTPKDLTGATLTYTIFTDKGSIVIRKSSTEVEEIEILNQGTDLGKCRVYLLASDSVFLNGLYRHQMSAVDVNGHEETVMTGKVLIFGNFSKRQKIQTLHAYLAGG